MEGGKPTVIANAVCFDNAISRCSVKNGDRLSVKSLKRQAVMNPENTFLSVKRFIGRRYDEVTMKQQKFYKVLRDSNGNVKLDCPSKVANVRPGRNSC